MRNRLIALFLPLLLASCNNGGQDFCTANHGMGTPSFQQCIARYQQQSSAYSYCTREAGIHQEGPALQQCLRDAPAILAERDYIRRMEQERQQEAEYWRRERDEWHRYDNEEWDRKRHPRNRSGHERTHDERGGHGQHNRGENRPRDIAHGEVLECSIQPGRLFMQSWKAFHPIRFDIARGERKTLPAMTINGEATAFVAHYGSKGNALSICDRSGNADNCATLNGMAALYEKASISQRFSTRALFQNALLTCNFAQGTARKKR